MVTQKHFWSTYWHSHLPHPHSGFLQRSGRAVFRASDRQDHRALVEAVIKTELLKLAGEHKSCWAGVRGHQGEGVELVMYGKSRRWRLWHLLQIMAVFRSDHWIWISDSLCNGGECWSPDCAPIIIVESEKVSGFQCLFPQDINFSVWLIFINYTDIFKGAKCKVCSFYPFTVMKKCGVV